MIARILEVEAMDSLEEAIDYNSMDHSDVNRRFVADFLATGPDVSDLLDLGTGTALIPIELCRVSTAAHLTAIDLAPSMLKVGAENVVDAGLSDRVTLVLVDSKRLPYPDGRFSGVLSNSIVHHVPEPIHVLREAVRVCGVNGILFFRDLLRPDDMPTLSRLVDTYAADCNDHQRQMFADSLHAALTLDEVRQLVASLGFTADTVQATSDRHWTWCARNAASSLAKPQSTS